MRKLLIGWRSCHQARFGEGSWAAAGPDPECIGMHRLSERTMLQSDTCNAARATKALVAEMAEAASRDKHGISDADWEAMDETARASKSQARPCLRTPLPPPPEPFASTLQQAICPVLGRCSSGTATATSATSSSRA